VTQLSSTGTHKRESSDVAPAPGLSSSVEHAQAPVVAVEMVRRSIKQRVHLIWTGGTIASVLRGEACGPEFANTLNDILETAVVSSTENMREALLKGLDAVPVRSDRLHFREIIFTLVERAAEQPTVDDMVDALQRSLAVSVPGLTGADFIEGMPADLRHSYEFIVHNPFPGHPFGFDSTEMLPDHMEKIAAEIEKVATDRGARVIVTHGTDTMTNTASYAAFRSAGGLTHPIVFTGSQIRPGNSHTDAYNNFALARDASKLPLGEVLLAFGEQVVRAVAASKIDSTQKQGMGSPHQEIVGEMAGAHLKFKGVRGLPPVAGTAFQSLRYPFLTGRSEIVRMDPLMAGDHELLRTGTMNPALRDAVVIEGYASGNIPMSIATIIEEASKHMHIIIAPSGATREVQETMYEGSPEVSHPGAIFAKGTVSSVANMKFQWLYRRADELELSPEERHAWIRSRYGFNYAHEHPVFDGPLDEEQDVPMSRLDPANPHVAVFKYILLQTGEPIADPTKTTLAEYGEIIERRKRAWLESLAVEVAVPEGDHLRWIDSRMKMKKIPLETMFGVWDPVKNDRLWDAVRSTKIDAYVVPRVEEIFPEFDHDLGTMLAGVTPDSQMADINREIVRDTFQSIITFFDGVFRDCVRTLKDQWTDDVGDAEAMKEEVIESLALPLISQYVTQREIVSVSLKRVRTTILRKFSGTNRDMLDKLLEASNASNSNADALPHNVRELFSGVVSLVARDILSDVMNRANNEDPGRYESLDHYLDQKLGMTMVEAADFTVTKLMAGDRGQDITPHGDDGMSVLDVRQLRHDINDALSPLFLQKQLDDLSPPAV